MCAKWCAILILPVFFLSGCKPPSEGVLDEQKDPHFLRGRNLVRAMDYQGAIEAFEKALEANPRSAMAHFELGLLYEQKETDFAAAIFHYNKVIKLKGNAHPADNARQRIAGCKQELVKSESLAPAYQTLLRDLDRLKDENLALKKKLEAWQGNSGQRLTASTNPPLAGTLTGLTTRPGAAPARKTSPELARDAGEAGNRGGSAPSGGRPENSTARGRTHLVQSGETATAIARKYGLKLNALLLANPTLEPRRMRTGQTVNIPSS
jgi:tetratricopeptide (TPR) repeat protein